MGIEQLIIPTLAPLARDLIIQSMKEIAKHPPKEQAQIVRAMVAAGTLERVSIETARATLKQARKLTQR